MAADGDDLPAFTLETGSCVEALRAARRESRTALDQQITLLHEIDSKAMRTIRTAVVVLGVLVSGAGVAGPRQISDLGFWPVVLFALGTTCLLGCVFVGVGLYAVSTTDFGVGDSFRRDVQAGNYSERAWLLTVLRGHDEWEAEMKHVNRRKEAYLFVSQSLLLFAFVAFTAAVTLSVIPH